MAKGQVQQRAGEVGATGRWPCLMLILPPLFWAANIVVGRGINALIPPVALAFWRWVLAFALITPFTWPRARRDWPLVRANLPLMFLLSSLGVSAFGALLYTAVRTTTAINGSLVQTTLPAFVILFSLLLYRESVSGRQILGVALAVAGAGWVVVQGELGTLAALSFVPGDLIILLAVILYALYSVLLRRRPPVHALSFLFYTFSFGALILVPFYLWELAGGATFALTRGVLLSIGFVALFPSIFAYLTWNRGVILVGANRAGLYITLLPLFTALLSVAFLDEGAAPLPRCGPGAHRRRAAALQPAVARAPHPRSSAR